MVWVDELSTTATSVSYVPCNGLFESALPDSLSSVCHKDVLPKNDILRLFDLFEGIS